MTPARAALAVLGVVFVAAGAVLSATVDSLIGLAVLVVGAFLLVLPLTSVHDE